MDKWAVEIEARLENPEISQATRTPLDMNTEKHPSIYGNWKCWDDFGVSFLTETQKWQFVACMTHRFGLNVRSYLEYMQDKVDLTWSYYRKFLAQNNERFIEHLLVNSCFFIIVMIFLCDEYLNVILEKCMDQNSQRPIDIYNIVCFIRYNLTSIKTYLFTMEYQIPWFVVEAVYTELTDLTEHFSIPIHKFVVLSFWWKTSKVDGSIPLCGFKHALHILHWSQTLDGKYLVEARNNKWISFIHIPSATELRLSQIVFRKHEGRFYDLSYSDNKRISGVIQLTCSSLFQYKNKVICKGLLNFEFGYGRICGMHYTACIVCMACLLKTEADVRVLRESGIIPSTILDDNEVLHCVQELKNLIAANAMTPNELIDLEEKVMAHYQRSSYRVYGEFKKRYCANPWIIISVIAGMLLFVLTFLQTLYGILGYYNQ